MEHIWTHIPVFMPLYNYIDPAVANIRRMRKFLDLPTKMGMWLNNPYLVGGLEHFLLSLIYGIILPPLTFIFFRWVGIPPTRSSIYFRMTLNVYHWLNFPLPSRWQVSFVGDNFTRKPPKFDAWHSWADSVVDNVNPGLINPWAV